MASFTEAQGEGVETRINAFRVTPESIVITTDRKHFLFQLRGLHPVFDLAWFSDVLARGIIDAVLLYKEDGKCLVVEGRQRTMAARAGNALMTRTEELLGKGADAAALAPEMEKILHGLKLFFTVDAETAAIWAGIFTRRKFKPYKLKALFHDGTPEQLAMTATRSDEMRTDNDEIAKAAEFVRLLGVGVEEDDARDSFRGGRISPATAERWKKLAKLGEPLKKAVRAGTLAAGAAASLGELPREKQTEALDAMVAAGVTRGAKALTAAAQLAKGEAIKATEPAKRSEYVLVGGAGDGTLEIRRLKGKKPKGAKRMKLVLWMCPDGRTE